MNGILLGNRSFAARGLAQKLTAAGHQVFLFGRGPLGRTGNVIQGPMSDLAANPHWPEQADWILNFIILRDQTIAANIEYCRQVVELGRRLGCQGLIHISSVSSLSFAESVITEDSAPAAGYDDKPFYAAVKIATDNYLRDHNAGLKVLFVRPGFILGPGHVNVMVGTAAPIMGGWTLLMGNPAQQFPLTTCDLVQEAVLRLIHLPETTHGETFLLVDNASPTKKNYIRACLDELGQGSHLVALGSWFWYPAALCGEGLARLMGNRKPLVYSRITQTFHGITYDSSRTARTLGLDLKFDWRQALRQCYDGQEWNFSVPPAPSIADRKMSAIRKVLFVGLGGIVFQKHLPALRALGFNGDLDIYDPGRPQLPKIPFPARAVEQPEQSDAELAVLACPPAFRTDLLERLPASIRGVMIEKPLVLNYTQYERWMEAESRGPRIFTAIHNYRYKRNVRDFLEYIARRNPGRLQSVRVQIDAGFIHGDSIKWRREERPNKLLLHDVGIHYLDLACMLGRDFQDLSGLTSRLDSVGNTAEIAGQINFRNYFVTFHLRQGHGIVRQQVHFDFTNYSVRLGFHPDTFVVLFGRDMILNRFYETWNDFARTFGVVLGKLTRRDPDQSHARVYQECLRQMDGARDSQLSMQGVEPTYRILSAISRMVYGDD